MNTTQTQAPNLVTIAEAAKLLGVHPNTVRNRIKTGLLPAEKMLTPNGDAYMIPRTSIEDALQSPLQNVGTLPGGSNELLSSNGAQNDSLVTLTTGSQGTLTTLLQQLVAPLIEATAHHADELRHVEALYREQIAAKDELIAELRRRAEEAEHHTNERATPEHGNARFRVLRWLAHQLT